MQSPGGMTHLSIHSGPTTHCKVSRRMTGRHARLKLDIHLYYMT